MKIPTHCIHCNLEMYKGGTRMSCKNCICSDENYIVERTKMTASQTWIAIYFDEKKCSLEFNLRGNEIIVFFPTQNNKNIYLQNNKPDLDLTNRTEVLNFLETILTFS